MNLANRFCFVLLILFCAGCTINAQNQSNPDIRGTIIKLSRSDSAARSNKLPGSILVERDLNGSGEYDKADVKITKETRIFAQADRDKNTPLEINALRLNQRVEVRFTPEPALLTYPIQVGNDKFVSNYSNCVTSIFI